MTGLLIACLVLNIISLVLLAVLTFHVNIDVSIIFTLIFVITIIGTYVLNIITIIKCLGRLV